MKKFVKRQPKGSQKNSSNSYLLIIVSIFCASRLFLFFQYQFDISPVNSFMQYLDLKWIVENPVDALTNNRAYAQGPTLFIILSNLFAGSYYPFILNFISFASSLLVLVVGFRCLNMLFPSTRTWALFFTIFWTLNPEVISLEHTFHYMFYSTCYILLTLFFTSLYFDSKNVKYLFYAALCIFMFGIFRVTFPPIFLLFLLISLFYYIGRKSRDNSQLINKSYKFIALTIMVLQFLISVNCHIYLRQINSSQISSGMLHSLLLKQVGSATLKDFAAANNYPSWLGESGPYMDMQSLEKYSLGNAQHTNSVVRNSKVRSDGSPNWSNDVYKPLMQQSLFFSLHYIYKNPEPYWDGVKWQIGLTFQNLTCQVGYRNNINRYDAFFRKYIWLENGNNYRCSSLYTGSQKLDLLAYLIFILSMFRFTLDRIFVRSKVIRSGKYNKFSQKYFVIMGGLLVGFFFFTSNFIGFGEQARYKFEYKLILYAIAVLYFLKPQSNVSSSRQFDRK
jgi:hypothetical protein